jgi:hypothetical protein
MNNNTPQWYDPLYNLIENHLEKLDKTPAPKQGASRELEPDNHQAHIGRYILMCQEHLTAEEQKDLFQVTCLTPAQRKEYCVYYEWFVRWGVDRELP